MYRSNTYFWVFVEAGSNDVRVLEVQVKNAHHLGRGDWNLLIELLYQMAQILFNLVSVTLWILILTLFS